MRDDDDNDCRATMTNRCVRVSTCLPVRLSRQRDRHMHIRGKRRSDEAHIQYTLIMFSPIYAYTKYTIIIMCKCRPMSVSFFSSASTLSFCILLYLSTLSVCLPLLVV